MTETKTQAEEYREDQPLNPSIPPSPPNPENRSFIISTWHIILQGSLLSVAGFFAALPVLIIITFAGQLSVFDLDVVGLVISGQMLIVTALTQGALWTFQPQFAAVIACGDNVRVRSVFQTGIVAVSILFCILPIPLLLLSPLIFIALQQNHQVAYAAGYCLMGTIPGLFGNLLHEVLANLYIAQQLGIVVVGSTFTMFIICLIFNFVLVLWLKLGLIGIIISLNIYYFSALIVLLSITFFMKSQRDLINVPITSICILFSYTRDA